MGKQTLYPAVGAWISIANFFLRKDQNVGSAWLVRCRRSVAATSLRVVLPAVRADMRSCLRGPVLISGSPASCLISDAIRHASATWSDGRAAARSRTSATTSGRLINSCAGGDLSARLWASRLLEQQQLP